MTPAEQLLVALAVLVAAFSGVWVRPGGAAVVTRCWGRPRVRTAADAALGNAAGGLVVGNLTPFGECLVTSRCDDATACDPAAARQAVDAARTRARPVRRAARVLFLYSFGVLTAAVFNQLPVSLSWAAGGYAVLLLVLLVLYRRAGGKGVLLLLVSPADAFRAADKLVRLAAEQFHPVALAAGLCAPADAAGFVRAVRLELLHPRPGEPAADELRRAVEAGVGGDPLPPPEREADAVGYCRRCDGQFVRLGPCPTCGLAIIGYESGAGGQT